MTRRKPWRDLIAPARAACPLWPESSGSGSGAHGAPDRRRPVTSTAKCQPVRAIRLAAEMRGGAKVTCHARRTKIPSRRSGPLWETTRLSLKPAQAAQFTDNLSQLDHQIRNAGDLEGFEATGKGVKSVLLLEEQQVGGKTISHVT